MAWCWGRHRPASHRRCQAVIGQVLTDQTTANTAQGTLLALAEADLAIAQDAATRNALTSPIAGPVAAISIAAGDTVAASSTSAVVAVIGDDGFVVTTTVPLSSIETVEVGARAEVTAASTPEVLVGAVSSIGVLNALTSTSDPSYTVIVAVDVTEEPLSDGASAQIVITVADEDDTLTVPSSAVHVDGAATTVQVLSAGAVRDVAVEVGAVGSELTEVVSGLTEGDEVVLADLSEVLVSDDEGSTGSSLSSLTGSTGRTGPTGMPDG